MLAICTSPFPPLAEVAPWVSQPIAEIVERGLARHPRERWPDLDAMIAAFAPHLADETEVSMSALVSVDPGRLATRAVAVHEVRGANASAATLLAGEGAPAFQAIPPPSDWALAAPPAVPTSLPSMRASRTSTTRGGRSIAALASMIAAVSLIAGGAIYAGAKRHPSEGAVAPEVTTSKLGALDDAPVSKVPGATEAYRRGFEASRDAQRATAISELDTAVKLDPGFAAAHLRRAMSRFPMRDEEQDHLRDAIRLRASLGAHDRIVLDALAPLVQVPQDITQAGKLLARAVDTAPEDPDFALQLCRLQQNLGDYDRAKETCARSSALDPGAAAPMFLSAIVAVRLEDVPAALASFGSCLEASPLATSCLLPLMQLQGLQGQCEDALASGRRLLAADPSNAEYYGYFASLLAGAGQPIDSVRLALDERIARTDAADVLPTKLQGTSLLAIFTGDFERAENALREWSDAVAKSPDEAEHLPIGQMRVQLAEEEGERGRARDLAAGYLAQRPAWTPIPEDDPSIFFDGELYRVGAISHGEFVARRDKWLAWKRGQPKGNAYGSSLGFAWIAAYAAPATTPEDARDALAVLPDYLPLPDPSMWSPDFEQPIGHAYLLAGREREALPFLSRAAKSCLPFMAPFEEVVASLELGLAEEAAGDATAACEAYRAVTLRWGAARSQSGRRARGRLLALHCRP
jgi:serine/threonine-protein kinase